MIRPYTEADWQDVCEVYDGAKPFELRSAGVEASFVPLNRDEQRMAGFRKHHVFVWNSDSRIGGFVGYRDDAYIGWLFVHPALFRRGIGRQLLRHAVQSISGVPWLWMMKDNVPAVGLYTSEGFSVVESKETNNAGMACIAVKLVKTI